MIYVEAPFYIPKGIDSGKRKIIFLAGGITGCPDWQKRMVEALSHAEVILLNPRRANFPIDDKDAAFQQIRWEYIMLRIADAVLFWFPKETLCPIVLYELGARSTFEQQPIFVGVEPGYKREQDVRIQLSFARPEVQVTDNLLGLANQVLHWIDGPMPERNLNETVPE